MPTAAHTIIVLSLLTLVAPMTRGQGQNPPAQTGMSPTELRTGIYRSRTVTYAVIDGKNVYEGDILLEKVEPLLPHDSVLRGSLTIAYANFLWPKVSGIVQVPYIITNPADNLNAAVTSFNTTFSGFIQFVPRASQSDFVNFNFTASDPSGQCEAFVGKIGGAQQIGGSSKCSLGTILHEMGHTIGLWHEQSRADRDTYVNVMYNNIIKGSRSNFDQLLDNAQILTLYDYASVMHYIPFAFSRNGGPTIESIPAGIPLSNSAGYTASDIDAISRLYGSVPTLVTVTTNPPGLQVIVDGATITTPQAFSWALHSVHTLDVPVNAQTLSGTTYIYGRWSDNTLVSHSITVVPGDGRVAQPTTSPATTVYTANFIELVGFNPIVSPANSGSITENPLPKTAPGVTGNFYVVRQPVTFTATPVTGRNFYQWFAYLPGAVSSDPKTVYMESKPPSIDVTAEFTTDSIITITASPPDPSRIGVHIDGAFWYAPKNFSVSRDPSWTVGSSHTISVDSPQLPNSINTRYAFNNWSDAGGQTHTISVPAGNSVFSANFTPQYVVIENVPASCAGSISVAPPSPTNDGFYPSGTPVTFTEQTNPGWTYTEWMNDLSGQTSPQMLTVSDETLVTADFNTAAVPLTVSSLNPSSAIAGGAGFSLAINGAGFTSGSIVFVNNVFRPGTTFVSSTQLAVPIQAADIATAGAFQVGVENFPSGAVCGVFAPKTFFVLTNGKITTSTGVVSSLNPSAFGQSVTVTATVTPSKPGSPTGNVSFFDGATMLGTSALNASLQAAFTSSTLAAGAHSITAAYAGDTNFSASTSTALAQTVNKAASTTTLASSKNPSSFGQSISLTATVKSATTGTPGGNVTFKDGALTLATGNLNSSGVATFTSSTLSVGTHSLAATYNGSSSFLAGTSSVLSQSVNKAASTTKLTTSKNPSSFNQPVTLTATVRSTTSGTPGGSVTFKDGSNTLGTGNLNSSGVANFTTSILPVGIHSLTAVYGGNANFTGSTSPVLTQTVNKAGSTTTLSSSINPSTFGQSVTFTAKVKPATSGTPTGTVTFKDGGTTLGTGSLNSSASATFTISTLGKGVHSITAAYGGDSKFAGSTSATLTETVQ